MVLPNPEVLDLDLDDWRLEVTHLPEVGVTWALWRYRDELVAEETVGEA